ncbi:DUF3231 family protein [Neobacillus sp. Marseille-QA0830]
MDLIKPININASKLTPDNPMTAVEVGKMWATYVGNSMSNRILSYYLRNVEDEDIKTLLENSYNLTIDFMERIKTFFNKENFPIPVGFTEEDVNLDAPRLFEDEFYVHYLKYAAKAGLSLYAVAVPLAMREDVHEFFIHCNKYTTILLGQINNILMEKGYIIKPPEIPVPKKVEFVKKQGYMKGFIGDVRPLHAMEITHLYDNIESNCASKALLVGFSQVAKNEKARNFFLRGKEITQKAVEHFSDVLNHDHLPAPSLIDHLVTDSTVAPFSDKLMVFHKIDMFNIKIRAFGNSLSLNGRRDVGLLYFKSIADVTLFVEDGANIMIENGWMEEPPHAVDRDHLSAKQN